MYRAIMAAAMVLAASPALAGDVSYHFRHRPATISAAVPAVPALALAYAEKVGPAAPYARGFTASPSAKGSAQGISYSLSGSVPAGISVDPTTGVVSGTMPFGQRSVVVVASSGDARVTATLMLRGTLDCQTPASSIQGAGARRWSSVAPVDGNPSACEFTNVLAFISGQLYSVTRESGDDWCSGVSGGMGRKLADFGGGDNGSFIDRAGPGPSVVRSSSYVYRLTCQMN